MNQQIKNCQNCKTDFTIEPEDFDFYERIKVPPPTFCPECRMIRRFTWRNERSLHRRKDAFGKDLLSIYAPEVPVQVYDRDYWWSDQWDPLSYGRPYDFTKPFFAQFRELLQLVPLPNVFANSVTDSPYANHVGYLKNCYLLFASWECENSLYANRVIRTKDTLDACVVADSELCYEVVDCEKSNSLLFSQECSACFSSAFLYDCRSCSNCFGCVGLRNKEYYIFNQPYTREEYKKKIEEFSLGDYGKIQEFKEKLRAMVVSRPQRFAHLVNAVNTIGDHCKDIKNSYYCFDLIDNIEDSKYLVNGGLGLKDSYDGFGIGASAELIYEGVDSGVNGSLEKFSIVVYGCHNTDYCFNCENSSDLFGCIGLRKKQYCIFNKQYSKEEYFSLREQIINHMNEMPYVDAKDRTYRYGEFFPSDLSPFAYNETIAQESYPLTKEDATSKGYAWRDKDDKSYSITKRSEDLPAHIKDVGDSVLKETISCMHNGGCNEQCSTAFRITPEELMFYRRMNLALPRLCSNCRHYARLKQRNPLKLWHRTCMCSGTSSQNTNYQNTAAHFHSEQTCPNEFETSYDPDRSEIVYCEQCYQSEIS